MTDIDPAAAWRCISVALLCACAIVGILMADGWLSRRARR